MEIFSQVTGFFGLRNPRDDDADANHDDHERRPELLGGDGSEDRDEKFKETDVQRRGFSVQVSIERPGLGPVLSPCDSSDGGIQGLRWCAKGLKMDQDGDVAHEFLDEVVELHPHSSPSLASLEQLE